jgi:hypothetical protein
MLRAPEAKRGDIEKIALVAESPSEARRAPTEIAPATKNELDGDDIALMAPGASDNSNSAPRRPHPITAAHQRNFEQINLVAELNGAMDLGDVDELRRANRKYREEYPEASLLQDGYDLIADCMENRSAAARAAATSYWDTQLASNLRRYVRRYCLE